MRLSLGRDAQVTYRVTMPDITSAAAAGGADIVITGIEAASLRLVAAAGANVEASGTCDSLSASASSGSDIKAFELNCSDVTADATSGSDIAVVATKSIKASATSGADIMVRGNPPQQTVRTNSGGDVLLID